MSKHRTKKQKMKTQERRAEVVQQPQVQHTQSTLQYTIPTLSPQPSTPKERAWDNQRVAFFKKDMLKTIVVSLVIVGIIFFLKWKFAL